MPSDHKARERAFQDHIVNALAHSGWLVGESANYDRERALYPEDLIAYVQQSQPEGWGKFCKTYGEEPEHVHVDPGFYAYKLNGRLATRQEKARLGRLIVRRIPELIPAIKSYPLSEPEQLRPCRKLFQSVKAKKRLTEIEALIAALFR